jgi:hypothetical protein
MIKYKKIDDHLYLFTDINSVKKYKYFILNWDGTKVAIPTNGLKVDGYYRLSSGYKSWNNYPVYSAILKEPYYKYAKYKDSIIELNNPEFIDNYILVSIGDAYHLKFFAIKKSDFLNNGRYLMLSPNYHWVNGIDTPDSGYYEYDGNKYTIISIKPLKNKGTERYDHELGTPQGAYAEDSGIYGWGLD